MTIDAPKTENGHGGRREGAGAIPYEPTPGDRTTVTVMHACGKTHQQIARCIGPKGISPVTLRKHFRLELNRAKDHVDGICTTGLVKLMQEGNLGAICFYAKTRMGWREVTRNEHILEATIAGKPEKSDALKSLEARIAEITEPRGTEEMAGASAAGRDRAGTP